jgi:hypothetical protein
VQTPFTKVTHEKPVKTTTPGGALRLHQAVKHKNFGLGIVKKIEQKGEQTIITAQFPGGTKKIKSDFLTPL